MSNYYDQGLALHGQAMPAGTTRRIECPECGHREMSLTRTAEGLLYHCHRAKCGLSGFLASIDYSRGEWRPGPEKPTTHCAYGEDLLTLETIDERYFQERFGLAAIHAATLIRRNVYGQYVLRVFDPLGRERGLMVRRIAWSGEPKAPRMPYTITGPKTTLYMHRSDYIAQSWHFPPAGVERRHDKLVVVEDQVSAMKVSELGFKCVAIMGCHLDITRVREIALERPQEVMLALDTDATANAFSLAGKWGMAFPKLRVAVMAADPKDSTAYDLLEAFDA